MDTTIEDIASLCVPTTATLGECIAAIGENRRQIALIVDDDEVLRGIVTDGDIRRGILGGASLETPVTEIMNPRPITASPSDPQASILGRLSAHEAHHVPVVDADGRVVAVATLDDLLGRHDSTTPVVLMAGGRGQRLYPLTKDVPKPMLPVGGVPLLEIILRRLEAQGFRDIRVSVNYLADVIMDYVGDGSRFGVSVSYLHEDKPLGTAGALGGLQVDEPFIVMNSDLLTHVDMRDMLAFHAEQAAVATIGAREHVVEVPFGVIELQGNAVTAMVEKPRHRSLVNAGVYVLDPDVLARITPGEYVDMPTVLSQLMAEGRTVAAFPIHEPWLDVGRPEDLDAARSEAAKWID